MRVRAGEVADAVSREADGAVVTLVVEPASSSQRVLTVPADEAATLARELGDVPLIVAAGAPEEALRWAERRP